MNENAYVAIYTPMGLTKTITLTDIVRHGIIMGHTLCTIETDKINTIGEKSITSIGPGISIQNLIYVDDVAGIGTRETIEATGRNLVLMEERKKFTFNNAKTVILPIINNNKDIKRRKTPIIQVKRGEVGTVESAKYLGECFFTKDLNKNRINKKHKYGDLHKAGSTSILVKLKILEAVAMPALTYNMETWTNLTDQNYNTLGSYQKRLICSIFNLDNSAPTWGLLKEVGIWHIKQIIHYKKFMLFHYIMNSSDTRMARKILVEQHKKEYPDCWYSEIKGIAITYDINLDLESIMNITKSRWKKQVKGRINEEITRMDNKLNKGRKSRFLAEHDFTRQEYINKLTNKEVMEMIKLRLNMTKVKDNFKNMHDNNICEFCKQTDDTTEHIFECNYFKRITGIDMRETNLQETSCMEKLKKIVSYVNRVNEIKNRFC